MRLLATLAVAAVTALPFASAQAAPKDIVETIGNKGTFVRMLEAADRAGLTPELRGAGPITVFAPTDDAFDRLDPDFLDYIVRPENRDELAALLKKHVVPGRHDFAKLAETDGTLDTLLGAPLPVSAEDGIFVGEARITVANIEAANGIVHAIDRVIEPKL
jgi:uncharacterized surface protein with fasciclin (FAS1) repeats